MKQVQYIQSIQYIFCVYVPVGICTTDIMF